MEEKIYFPDEKSSCALSSETLLYVDAIQLVCVSGRINKTKSLETNRQRMTFLSHYHHRSNQQETKPTKCFLAEAMVHSQRSEMACAKVDPCSLTAHELLRRRCTHMQGETQTVNCFVLLMLVQSVSMLGDDSCGGFSLLIPWQPSVQSLRWHHPEARIGCNLWDLHGFGLRNETSFRSSCPMKTQKSTHDIQDLQPYLLSAEDRAGDEDHVPLFR